MKPLRNRFQEARKLTGLSWEILEKDYIISWLLSAIYQVDVLRNSLVFKGGTALKKCYFGTYRFSEDLDFTAVGNIQAGKAMEQAIQKACMQAVSLIDKYAPVDIKCERYTEREPHPGGQEAFVIRTRFPWQREHQTKVMIEITLDEPIFKPIKNMTILHEYGESLETLVPVYSLEEILAEKLRAILQHIERLKERGWSRSRARDYYDLWRILGTYKKELELSGFKSFLIKKCAIRDVTFETHNDFFQKPMLDYIDKTWDRWLGSLVPDLPLFEVVIGELRPLISFLLIEKL